MHQEIILIKFLLSRDNYNKYASFVKDLNLEQESKLLLNSITEYFKEYPDTDSISVQELLAYNILRNPTVKRKDSFELFFSALDKATFNSALVEANFNAMLEKYFASEILFDLSEALEQDTTENTLTLVKEKLNQFELNKLNLGNNKFKFISNNIEEIVAKQLKEPGIKWRLSSLNEHLGDITGKTLGHIFARVDTGKTSFVISEEAHWVTQLKDDEVIVHFNNEEDGEKVMTRFYQALLNRSKEFLFSNPGKCQKEFKKRGGDRLLLFDEAIISIETIESILSKHNVKVVVIDQADKISFIGQHKFNDVARLQQVYARLRELSKKYNVHILTVGQASQSAENKKWLVPTDVDSSKTLKPGEFDYIIGIGRMFGEALNQEDIRYIHLCKNKLGTGQHAQVQVLFNRTRAIYREPTYEELEIANGNIPPSAKVSPDKLAYCGNS